MHFLPKHEIKLPYTEEEIERATRILIDLEKNRIIELLNDIKNRNDWPIVGSDPSVLLNDLSLEECELFDDALKEIMKDYPDEFNEN